MKRAELAISFLLASACAREAPRGPTPSPSAANPASPAAEPTARADTETHGTPQAPATERARELTAPAFAPRDTFAFGASLAALGDCDGDGARDVAIADLESLPGPAAWVVSSSTGASLHAFDPRTLGREHVASVGALADIDGDGVDDWCVQAYRSRQSLRLGFGHIDACSAVLSGQSGAVLAVLEDPRPRPWNSARPTSVRRPDAARRTLVWTTRDASDRTELHGRGVGDADGWTTDLAPREAIAVALLPVEDLDHDAFGDVVCLTATRDDPCSTSVSIVSGRAGHVLARFAMSGGYGTPHACLIAPDVDHDGVEELVIARVGCIEWWSLVTHARVGLVQRRDEDSQSLGNCLGRTSDVDGDGVDDLAAGDPCPCCDGEVLLLSGTSGERVGCLTPPPCVAHAGGESPYKWGCQFACLGDIDGDARPDFAVVQASWDIAQRGRVWFVSSAPQRVLRILGRDRAGIVELR